MVPVVVFLYLMTPVAVLHLEETVAFGLNVAFTDVEDVQVVVAATRGIS